MDDRDRDRSIAVILATTPQQGGHNRRINSGDKHYTPREDTDMQISRFPQTNLPAPRSLPKGPSFSGPQDGFKASSFEGAAAGALAGGILGGTIGGWVGGPAGLIGGALVGASNQFGGTALSGAVLGGILGAVGGPIAGGVIGGAIGATLGGTAGAFVRN